MRILTLSVPTADAELAADRLWVAGARAVEEQTQPRTVVLRTILADTDDVSLERLGRLPDGWVAGFEDVDDVPTETWREFAKPIEINDSLVIRPAWLPPLRTEGVQEVEIEPGGSFGLGDHPTTRLSAAATWRLSRDRRRVLDVGCGSGVLSIIAAHRGAAEIIAIDIAEAAREATDDNARRNGVADRITASTTPLAEIEGRFDFVIANVLAPALVAMAVDLRRLTGPGGRLVVSGVLAGRHDHVVQALEPMRVVGTSELDGWAATELCHP
jgi:ribosomal protein L11 methyltransferase